MSRFIYVETMLANWYFRDDTPLTLMREKMIRYICAIGRSGAKQSLQNIKGMDNHGFDAEKK